MPTAPYTYNGPADSSNQTKKLIMPDGVTTVEPGQWANFDTADIARLQNLGYRFTPGQSPTPAPIGGAGSGSLLSPVFIGPTAPSTSQSNYLWIKTDGSGNVLDILAQASS